MNMVDEKKTSVEQMEQDIQDSDEDQESEEEEEELEKVDDPEIHKLELEASFVVL